jgi:hypothetical protein
MGIQSNGGKVMETKKIQVMVKNSFGNQLVYPVSQNAKYFTELTKKRTLTAKDLELIEAMGYEIEYVAQKLDTLKR